MNRKASACKWGLAAIALAAAPLAALMAQDWNSTFTQTERGNRVGNPQAELQLVEFVSYTCPHCADFEAQGGAAMSLLYVPRGLVGVEVRSYIRNPIDLAMTLAAQCGESEKHYGNHRALMLSHSRWMERARGATDAQMQRWSHGSLGSRMRAIATDLDIYALMEPRGFSRTQLDRCLADEAKAQEIIADHQANNAEFDIPGTPSFALNGQMLDGVHSWGQLQAVLDNPTVLTSEPTSEAQSEVE